MTAAPRFADFWSLRFSAGGLPLTQLLSQRLGAIAAFCALRVGLSPSAVTLLGLGVFAASAVLLATLPDHWASALLCLLLFQIAYALDCADGQLARATCRTSVHGAWLDMGCDYLRNVLLGAAAAYWLARGGLSPATSLLCGMTFTAGGVLYLHTLTVTRQAAAAEALGASRPLPLQLIAAIALDTPTVLLTIPLFRGTPCLLASYLVLMGVASFGAALHQARRLRSA